MPAGGHAITPGRHRQNLDVLKVHQQIGRRTTVGAVVAAARAGPVHAIAELIAWVARLDDYAAAAGAIATMLNRTVPVPLDFLSFARMAGFVRSPLAPASTIAVSRSELMKSGGKKSL
jgi:hypothetical protein